MGGDQGVRSHGWTHVGTSALTRGQRAGSVFPQVRTQEGAINGPQLRRHPDLGHLVSRTVRHKCLCFISHRVCGTSLRQPQGTKTLCFQECQ